VPVRTLADRLLLAKSLLAGPLALAAIVIAAVTFSDACATEQTKDAPDAGIAKCKTGPYYFSCNDAPAGQPACSTDDGSSPFLSRVPRGKSWTLGCVINFVGERDEEGDCVNEGVCKCILGQLPTEAGAPPGPDAAPPPPPPSVPLWDCSQP
jgi:hypothetical protein